MSCNSNYCVEDKGGKHEIMHAQYLEVVKTLIQASAEFINCRVGTPFRKTSTSSFPFGKRACITFSSYTYLCV